MFRERLREGISHVGLALREPEEFLERWHRGQADLPWWIWLSLTMTAILGTTTYTLGEWFQAASRHVWNLSGGWPLCILGLETLLVLQPAEPSVPRRFLRASLVLAVLAWAIPAVRSYDHPYYAVYFQLPLMAASAMLAARLWSFSGFLFGERKPLQALLPIALCTAITLAAVQAELDRHAPTSDRPSAARCGQELKQLVPDPHTIIAIDPGTGLDTIVLTHAAGKLVLELERGNRESEGRYLATLKKFGYDLADPRTRVVQAPGPWPGREGIVQLYPPPPE